MEYDIEIPGNIPTSAKGSSYGYLYQMMRALYWLSLSPPGSIIALETDDDIVIKLQNGANLEHIFEQDKASLDKKYPYSNKNINLWKTLSNWLNLINQKNIPIETSRFLLVTNVSTKSTNIIKQLNNKADRDENFFLSIYNDLRRIAEIEISKYSEPETDIKKQTLPYYAYNFLQHDASIVISLLKRIELCDLNLKEENLKEETIRNLRLNIEGLPSYDLYNSLYGWFIGLCSQLWISGFDAILNEKRLWEARDFWVKKFEQRPFIEKAAHLMYIFKLMFTISA